MSNVPYDYITYRVIGDDMLATANWTVFKDTSYVQRVYQNENGNLKWTDFQFGPLRADGFKAQEYNVREPYQLLKVV